MDFDGFVSSRLNQEAMQSGTALAGSASGRGSINVRPRHGVSVVKGRRRHRAMGQRAGSSDVAKECLAERTRIAQELHDTLLQGFFAVSMQLQAAVSSLPADSAA